MPIVPNAYERLALRSNQAPGVVLDYLGALGLRTVSAALRLGVFEALAGGARSTAEVARAIGADEGGTESLLLALDGLGYVTRRRERYRNSPLTAKWLLRSSPVSLVAAARFFEAAAFELWQGLEDSVRTGRPREPFYKRLERLPNLSRDFQAWLEVLAELAGDEIVSKVALSEHARRLLDVGGSHALHSIRFCRRYAQLSATVVDLPGPLETARTNVAEAGLEERITIEEADYLRDRLGSGYDVVLLFNILHAHHDDVNRALIERLSASINPGGLIVVWDQMSDLVVGSMAAATVGLFALGYHHLMGGRVYRSDDIERWLSVAGFRGIRRTGLLRAPGSALILATRG
ncbi:MAG TPA: methyltransferase [Candidatus Limnocylindrales bacterium]|jgi:2-polyprenyl-3-methyl-5-hydroxy-6-metoxy-1,4-benzoquinol methylase|nr:methyltransferase [Candidatus Limnocylindrales bacterium]